MKKNLKKSVLVMLALTLFSNFSYSKEIGKIINSVPVVTLSSSDLLTQINALAGCGVTNISLVESHLTYTPGSPGGGYFIYTINFTDTPSNKIYKEMVSVECIYNPANNIFEAKQNGTL